MCVLWVGFVLPASADPILPPSDLTLFDLVDGELSLTTQNEEVVFTNFAVDISGGSEDLEDYAIQTSLDGFKISSEVAPIAATLEIVLTYDVTTALETLAFDSAGFNVANGDVPVDSLLEIYNGQGQSIIEDGRVGNNAHVEIPFWVFTETARTAYVVQRMTVDLNELDGGWIVRNRFKTTDVPPPVPEPNTALLLGTGMVGLARYARRRRGPHS